MRPRAMAISPVRSSKRSSLATSTRTVRKELWESNVFERVEAIAGAVSAGPFSFASLEFSARDFEILPRTACARALISSRPSRAQAVNSRSTSREESSRSTIWEVTVRFWLRISSKRFSSVCAKLWNFGRSRIPAFPLMVWTTRKMVWTRSASSGWASSARTAASICERVSPDSTRKLFKSVSREISILGSYHLEGDNAGIGPHGNLPALFSSRFLANDGNSFAGKYFQRQTDVLVANLFPCPTAKRTQHASAAVNVSLQVFFLAACQHQ